MIKIAEEFKGKKVLIRSYDAGVFFGTLEDFEDGIVRMSDVRNIWHWTGASCLSQIANDGINGDKVSPVVSSMVITEVSQIMLLTDKAIENLENQPIWTY